MPLQYRSFTLSHSLSLSSSPLSAFTCHSHLSLLCFCSHFQLLLMLLLSLSYAQCPWHYSNGFIISNQSPKPLAFKYFNILCAYFSYLARYINISLSLTNPGNIKNTEPLDSKRQRVHSFWVTAFDCGKNRAQADAQVIVTVKPSCKPGWIGKNLDMNQTLLKFDNIMS